MGIVLSCKAHVPIIVWGHAGIGKTYAIKDLCRNPGKQFAKYREMLWGSSEPVGFVNKRASQLEPSDILGLPFLKKLEGSDIGVTAYAMIMDMPGSPFSEEKGILFFDELLRAPDDVMQALFESFEVDYDRDTGENFHRVGPNKFPSGWHVLAASNPYKDTENYIQNSFDDRALLNRLSHVSFEPAAAGYAGEFSKYIQNKYPEGKGINKAQDFLMFTSSDTRHMFGESTLKSIDKPIVQPSPRVNEYIFRLILANNELNLPEKIFLEVAAGLVGFDIARSFVGYSPPIRPIDIILKGKRAYSKVLETVETNEMRVIISCLNYNLDIVDKPYEQDSVVDLKEIKRQKANVVDFLYSACAQMNRTNITDVMAVILTKLIDLDIHQINLNKNLDQSMINLTAKAMGLSTFDQLAEWLENRGKQMDPEYITWLGQAADLLNKKKDMKYSKELRRRFTDAISGSFRSKTLDGEEEDAEGKEDE